MRRPSSAPSDRSRMTPPAARSPPRETQPRAQRYRNRPEQARKCPRTLQQDASTALPSEPPLFSLVPPHQQRLFSLVVELADGRAVELGVAALGELAVEEHRLR